jgi:hypothetical protein
MAQISLNEIVSALSDTVGQPFNIPLQEKLKVIVNYKRANYTQQSLEKHPEQRKFFQQSFTTELERIAKGDCEMPSVTCDVLRSKCEIPFPIRSSYSLFDFVGTPDWTVSFGEIKPEFNSLRSFNRFTKDLPKWSYINKKLYVFNDLTLKQIAVRTVFADPSSINSCCSTGTCYSDDAPYQIAPDLLNAIMRDILQVELRNQFPQPGVVEVPEIKDANNPVTI